MFERAIRRVVQYSCQSLFTSDQKLFLLLNRSMSHVESGAPNENIVQNHLNIALLIFLSPNEFFFCSDFLAESLVIRKL